MSASAVRATSLASAIGPAAEVPSGRACASGAPVIALALSSGGAVAVPLGSGPPGNVPQPVNSDSHMTTAPRWPPNNHRPDPEYVLGVCRHPFTVTLDIRGNRGKHDEFH